MRRLLYISTLIFSAGLLATSCNKEFELIAAADPVPAGKALLKINYTSAYYTNPGVQLKLNGERVSPVINARYPWPGGGFNTGGGSQADYLVVDPGATTVAVTIPQKNTNIDSVQVFTTNVTLDANKAYTVHIADTAANTKTLLTIDDMNQPDTGQTKFRFVNLMPNVAALDLYYGATLVAANVPYLGTSDYITMPVPASAQAWSIREAGADPASTALATYSSGNTTQSERVYTGFAMGYKQDPTDKRATLKPYISFYRTK